MTNVKPAHRKRTWIIVWTIVFLMVVGVLLFGWWLLYGRFHVTTNDAYVQGNQVLLTPEVGSSVTGIFADNTDLVKEGQLMVTLDPTDFEISFEEKKAALAETVKNVSSLFENVREKEATVTLRAAELRQAELDFLHRENLLETHAISLEEYEQYQTNVAVAKAALALAERELVSAKLLVGNTTVSTHPLVEEAVVEMEQAYVDLLRCEVKAPSTGYVAKRAVQVGDRVDVGDTLLTIVPLEDLWLDANFKETKLRKIRIGQPVDVWADIYGRRVRYRCNVVGLNAGTGSAFALLPPENASGNWIKIVQRLPVRVNFPIDQLEEHPLMIGLSLHVNVDVRDQSGPVLSQKPTEEPIYSTWIFNREESIASLDPLIDEIIETNSTF